MRAAATAPPAPTKESIRAIFSFFSNSPNANFFISAKFALLIPEARNLRVMRTAPILKLSDETTLPFSPQTTSMLPPPRSKNKFDKLPFTAGSLIAPRYDNSASSFPLNILIFMEVASKTLPHISEEFAASRSADVATASTENSGNNFELSLKKQRKAPIIKSAALPTKTFPPDMRDSSDFS